MGIMRTHYREDLEQLAGLLRKLCLQDRTYIATATNALINADLEQAERAIDLGHEIATIGEECEREAVRLLALQAPVAGELRRVVTAIQLVGDLTRMGALAEHIAAIARRRHPAHAVPEPVRPLLAQMGAAAIAMATGAAAVLESGDPEDAAKLDSEDDTMDQLHQQLLTTVLGDNWSYGTAAAIDLTLLGRYYERSLITLWK